MPAASAASSAGTPGPERDYLRALHTHIHRRWTDNFLRLAGEKLPPVNPLNQPGLTAEADIVVAGDGQLISARIVARLGIPRLRRRGPGGPARRGSVPQTAGRPSFRR